MPAAAIATAATLYYRFSKKYDDSKGRKDKHVRLGVNQARMPSSESIFFLLKFQTPVTLCISELWSILVVRLARGH